jgi:plasmid stability protein
MEAHMNQLTLRKIPGPVERKLRAEARKKGKSINKTAIEMLGKALGFGHEEKPRKKRDIRSVFHKWPAKQQREFEKNTMAFEQIDEEMWRE